MSLAMVAFFAVYTVAVVGVTLLVTGYCLYDILKKHWEDEEKKNDAKGAQERCRRVYIPYDNYV